MRLPVNHFINSFLRSFSQIMLQGNSVTGFLFIVGIGLNSPIMLLGASIAILSSLMIAKLFKYDLNSTQSGLYGFNSALVGIAVFFILPANGFSFVLILFISAFCTVVMHFMLHRLSGLPAFTTPFIVSTWLLFIFIDTVAIDTVANPFAEQISGDFYVVMRGVGQVMLQNNWLSGVVFVVGILAHSHKSAFWAIIGSVGGMIIARAFNFSEDVVFIGLYGFNASLVAIALAERYAKKQWLIFLGMALSVVITRAFEQLPIPALTAPFVLASWIIIGLVKINSKRVSNESQI
ncbi:urea transporter [Thalassotalea psychrophila]|uniref:Urea transporter n=1 Tax=Thalassotalea psychrophila TaxID=3065647 RepID=A0ABY9TWM4_9GAMM|nr:urea transporter [Colwelliaceae bacterium SQ149]